jgi:lipid II:glycine glycyltransferase (peptidoglycan interpeptide bridge formation enzyme)
MANAVGIGRLTREEWDTLTPLFRDLSYRQCGSYAEAAARDMGAASQFIGVFRAKELLGLANVRVKMVPFVPLGIAYVNYGPLAARGDQFSAESFGCCLDALRQEYVEHRRLMLRIVPPLRGGRCLDAQAACLDKHGFQPCVRLKPPETFILDLVNPLAEIRKNFDGKWRNDLSKAQRSNIEVTRSVAPADFDRFEALFLDLIQKKGFTARQDVAFFRRVQENAQAAQRLVAHLAWHDGELVAGHIGSFVGDTAVYLLGAANSKGREIRASYLLQWAVIEHAKCVGNRFYDLGGIDQESNPDVYRFKRRLNGRRVAELGPYEFAPARFPKRALHFLETAYNAIRRQRRTPKSV